MPLFAYSASDAAGQVHQGQLDAASDEAARQQLAARGWTVRQLEPAPPAASQTDRLAAGQAAEVVAHLADVSASGAPLVAGLRAAAAEVASPRVAAALAEIADEVTAGASLERVLANQRQRFPPHVRGLVAAAASTAQLGVALEELVDHHRALRETWWAVWGALAYPLLVLSLAAGVIGFLLLEVMPVFGTMFDDFQLDMPQITQGLVLLSAGCVEALAGTHKWLTWGSVLTAVAAVVCLRLVVGPARWRRFLGTVPVLGPVISWTGAAAFARMLAVLIDHGVPLPKALQLTADAVQDGNVRETCLALAAGAEQGRPLSELLAAHPRLPATLVPFVRCGERNGELSDALRTASEVFLGRIHLRASLLRTVSPQLIFVFVGLTVGLCVVAVFWPLFSLIQALA